MRFNVWFYLAFMPTSALFGLMLSACAGAIATPIVSLDSLQHARNKVAWRSRLEPASKRTPNFTGSSLRKFDRAQTLGADDLDLEPDILENSPVLQRWLEDTPDLLRDIRQDPAFRPRFRAGYSQIEDDSGFYIGVEDLLLGEIGNTRLALSADYRGEFEGDRTQWGADLRYYLLPLGQQVNLAPQTGYRSLTTPDDTIDGVTLGARLMLIPARTAAVDVSLTQAWIRPGNDPSASLTTLMAGYALTSAVRLSGEIQLQITPDRQDYRYGIGLEVLF